MFSRTARTVEACTFFIITMALQVFTKMKNVYMVTRDRSKKSATFLNNNIYSFNCTNLSLVLIRSLESHTTAASLEY